MLGFRLQIFGQYHGLLRNFCERSQSVSPFTIVYSSGVPGTGWMSVSGGGRGLSSVIGAFSRRGGFAFARCGAGCDPSGCSSSSGIACNGSGALAWGGTGGGG